MKPMLEIGVPRFYVKHHKSEFQFGIELDPESKTLDDLIFKGLQEVLAIPPESQSITKWWMLFTKNKTAIETIEMARQLPRGATILFVEKADVFVDWDSRNK
jgi:hypothetical protein